MIKKPIYSLLFLLTISCNLVDSIDQDPPDNLVPSNVVTDEDDARALLNGAYAQIVAYPLAHYYMHSELIPSAMIGTMNNIGDAQFVNNDLTMENTNVRNFWRAIYTVMDMANNSITLTAELPSEEISEETRMEIIGEAHFLRAMTTFDLLRYYGQFYDTSSELGVVLRTAPVNFVTRDKERSSVMECYTQILSDLDFAVENAPDFTVNYRASKLTAMALKAKVLLFMGEYAEAADMADRVINSGAVQLEGSFADVFDKGLSSTELIFQTYRDANSDLDQNNRKRFYSGRTGDTWFPELMEGDPRQPLTYSGQTILKVNNAATFRPTYFLRLAEMYLIKAEGLARSGATVEEARVPLNEIRNRVETGDSEAETMDELMDDIFEEIVRELAFENGSEWFAAIRFDKAMELKPSITSTDQYILPIPLTEIEGNKLIGYEDQNPGYNF
ncbi:RagB/SusD family nutrient uptake outer membrane protein [Sinomicrobium soli]|uniref:RagB/SusD family nutrient uptake outer membrane protein n=1 Tax=Sinomicrobium sp. N-1-3-6 TaxID=2219864 RepID=UPI000DCB746D|nr:RagB/SusD family nutrient uptake outer membrane protein [Sinomicrobium sp. N-1-3-6]RAV30951.1 RagB/SusD family nutrient uptake outer membrane protein [Sinomicrobium sp. N-1-3-6]